AWELRQDVCAVVVVDALHLQTTEQLVLVIQVVVQPTGIVVLPTVNRRIEDKAGGIQSVAKSRIVANRIARVHEGQKIGVGTDPQRIEGLQLRRGCGLHVPKVVDVIQLAGTECIVWNYLLNLCRQRVAPPFIVEEKEELIFKDRAADAAAKLVAVQRRLVNTVLVVEEVVRGKQRVPIVLVQ